MSVEANESGSSALAPLHTNKADSQVCDKILPQQSFVKYVNLVRATHDFFTHGSSSGPQ